MTVTNRHYFLFLIIMKNNLITMMTSLVITMMTSLVITMTMTFLIIVMTSLIIVVTSLITIRNFRLKNICGKFFLTGKKSNKSDMTN